RWTQAAHRIRRGTAAVGTLAPAGFLRASARAFDLQRARPAHAAPARAERARAAGDAGSRRILATPLPRHPPRVDAKIPEARLAGGRRHGLAAVSESPAVTAARRSAPPLREASARAAPRTPRICARAAGTARQDRKSTRLNSQSRGHLVCRLLLEKK